MKWFNRNKRCPHTRINYTLTGQCSSYDKILIVIFILNFFHRTLLPPRTFTVSNYENWQKLYARNDPGPTARQCKAVCVSSLRLHYSIEKPYSPDLPHLDATFFGLFLAFLVNMRQKLNPNAVLSSPIFQGETNEILQQKNSNATPTLGACRQQIRE